MQVKVVEAGRKTTDKSLERLMGNKPELRFEFIQERAEFAGEELRLNPPCAIRPQLSPE